MFPSDGPHRLAVLLSLFVTLSIATLGRAADEPGRAVTIELPRPGFPQSVGVQLKTDTFNIQTIDRVHALGFKVIRRGFYWATIEKNKGTYDFSEYDAQMDHAQKLGITVIGCLFGGNKAYEPNSTGAITTPEGRAETLLQKAFGADDDVVIGTKFGYDIYSPWERKGHVERPHDWSPAFIRFALEQSLKRLGRDTIDFYQLHNPRMDALRDDDLWAYLDELLQAGTVRSIGIALGPAIGWRDEGVWTAENRPVHAMQVIHNLLEQMPGQIGRAHV